MIIIHSYPKKERDRLIFVRHCVAIDDSIIESYKKLYKQDYRTSIIKNGVAGRVSDLKKGHFICVNVLADGYSIIPTATQFESEAECQKSCDIHNNFHGFSKNEARRIIYISMENSAELTKKGE